MPAVGKVMQGKIIMNTNAPNADMKYSHSIRQQTSPHPSHIFSPIFFLSSPIFFFQPQFVSPIMYFHQKLAYTNIFTTHICSLLPIGVPPPTQFLFFFFHDFTQIKTYFLPAYLFLHIFFSKPGLFFHVVIIFQPKFLTPKIFSHKKLHTKITATLFRTKYVCLFPN